MLIRRAFHFLDLIFSCFDPAGSIPQDTAKEARDDTFNQVEEEEYCILDVIYSLFEVSVWELLVSICILSYQGREFSGTIN